tara:strand:- start:8575 stop:8733 length:159 start_codon:yes stop_codon:yes gene_type:complete
MYKMEYSKTKDNQLKTSEPQANTERFYDMETLKAECAKFNKLLEEAKKLGLK